MVDTTCKACAVVFSRLSGEIHLCSKCKGVRDAARRAKMPPREAACLQCCRMFTRKGTHRTCNPCRLRKRLAVERTCQCGRVFKNKSHAKCVQCRMGQDAYNAMKRLERERVALRNGKPVPKIRNPVHANARQMKVSKLDAHREAMQRAAVDRDARAEAVKRAVLVQRLSVGLSSLLAYKREEEAAASQGLTVAQARWKARYADPLFRATHIGRARVNSYRRAAQASATEDGTMTGETIARMFAKANRCSYCNCKMKAHEKTLDHVVPLSKGGAHSILNAVVCCKPCNSRKHARDVSVMLTDGQQLPLVAA